MDHVLIIHDVVDYPAWKRVFDDAATIRRDAGERTYQVLRDQAAPNRVVHLSTWTSAAAARAFFESPQLVQIRRDAGVHAPEFVYLDEAEAGVLGSAADPWAVSQDADAAIVFRRAIAADLAPVVALLHDDDLGAQRNPLFDDAADAYRNAFADLARSPSNGEIVAERDGRIIGCYQLTFVRGLSHTGGERAQIESVRIAGDLRGGGLGTALMHDAIERARRRGCFLVQLTTDAARPKTRHFYERLGFVASHHGMKLRLDDAPA